MSILTYLRALPDRVRYTIAEEHLFDIARMRLDVEPGTAAHTGYNRQWATTAEQLNAIGTRLKALGVPAWDYTVVGIEALALTSVAGLAAAVAIVCWVAV